MTGIILTTKANELFKEKYFPDFFVHKINGRKFYVVKSLTDEMFVIAFCNCNEFDVASCATHLITNFNLDTLVHIGFGATENTTVNDYDVLLVNDVIDFNNKVEYTDDYFEINKRKIKIETNNELSDMIRKILSIANINYSLGQATLIYNKNISDLTNKNIPIIYDLESVPIALVCDTYKINFGLIKIKVNNQKKLSESLPLMELITYNIIQEISYNNLKKKSEKENL